MENISLQILEKLSSIFAIQSTMLFFLIATGFMLSSRLKGLIQERQRSHSYKIACIALEEFQQTSSSLMSSEIDYYDSNKFSYLQTKYSSPIKKNNFSFLRKFYQEIEHYLIMQNKGYDQNRSAAGEVVQLNQAEIDRQYNDLKSMVPKCYQKFNEVFANIENSCSYY